MLADQFVKRGCVMRRAFKKLVGERARLSRGFCTFPEGELELLGHLLAHVPLKQHLHGELARFCPQAHVICAALYLRLGTVSRNPAACATTAPFQSLLALPQILCYRPSIPRDQWP